MCKTAIKWPREIKSRHIESKWNSKPVLLLVNSCVPCSVRFLFRCFFSLCLSLARFISRKLESIARFYWDFFHLILIKKNKYQSMNWFHFIFVPQVRCDVKYASNLCLSLWLTTMCHSLWTFLLSIVNYACDFCLLTQIVFDKLHTIFVFRVRCTPQFVAIFFSACRLQCYGFGLSRL